MSHYDRGTRRLLWWTDDIRSPIGGHIDAVEAWPTAEQLAAKFHETYERLAPQHGYETREASAKPWSDVPEPNKSLMIAVAHDVLAWLSAPSPHGP